MTDLIPLDAAIACLTETFKGIGEREIDALDGWWETSSECDFGADRLNTAIVGLRAIPTIDPAAIREAALREAAAKCAEHAEAARKKLGASETSEEAVAWALIVTRCDLLEEAILALIGEKK